MKHIASRDNPTFKHLKQLAISARERRRTGRTLLDGVHLLEACLAAGQTPELLAVSQAGMHHAEIARLLGRLQGTPMVVLRDTLFAELSPVQTPLGLLAMIPIPQQAPPAHPTFCLLLEDIQDPGNLGAILRTAAAAGVEVAWLSPGCCDAWSPKVLRGGMGAHFVLPVVERADLGQQVRSFPGTTLAACLQGESLYRLDLTGPVAFLIGNEGTGLSTTLAACATRCCTIPMPGRMESLNVAAAAAVCLFECTRQRANKM